MADGNSAREEKALAISKDILTLSRNSLLVNFRFLDRAVSHLEFVDDELISLETDGEHLYYSPWYILSQYKAEPSAVTRNILHSIFHCVYSHNFFGPEIDRLRWDLACDIAVENTINSLASDCITASRARMQLGTIKTLQSEIGLLTAEKIYHYFTHSDIPDYEIETLRENFIGDNHSLWYGDKDEKAKFDKKLKLKKIWEDVSKRMQTELETMNKDHDSALVQNLMSLNRVKHNYSDFLRKFGIHGEVLKLSDEEFDNNYYTYGLELYENIPLIEPLEYSEQRRIRDFVIAIDTSGSVHGDIVQNFIQHTHDILMQRESFFTKINLHIIQCDHVIREDALITSADEFNEYIKNMELKGFETTDFRPVFSYVDNLIEKKLLSNLQGLIYFTDGLGSFPNEKPAYDTAFIIHRSDFRDPVIPVWAQFMTLSEEDILDKRF